MPVIPAFCDNCGFPFSSGIFVENVTHLTMSGNKSGPCPMCGGVGSIPDGIFNATHNAIEVLAAPQWTLDRLRGFAETLRIARDSDEPPEDIAERVREEAPELQSIADALPRTRMELYAFITLLLSALTILITQCSSGTEQGAEKQDAGTVLEQSIDITINND